MNTQNHEFRPDLAENWSGIHKLFGRWESWEEAQTAREEIRQSAAEVLETTENDEVLKPSAPVEKAKIIGINVPKGEIYVLASRSPVNERCHIYANIGGESILVGYTDAQSFNNGKINGDFFGQKGTLLEGVKEKFNASNQKDLDTNFRKWMLEKLAVKYPDDYEVEEKEQIAISKTTTGIEYTISGGTSEVKSIDRYIKAKIGDEIFYFLDYGFTKKGQNYIFWIKCKSGAMRKTQFQLKKYTEVSSKNFKDGVDTMLRKIEALLKSKDKKKQEIAAEIRKYIV